MTSKPSAGELADDLVERLQNWNHGIQKTMIVSEAIDEIVRLRAAAQAPMEKRAPVQGYSAGIPWSMHLRAYDAYCKEHGEQKAMIDLEGRNCRGGFGVSELDIFIPGWREELSELAALRAQIAQAPGVREPSMVDGDELIKRLRSHKGGAIYIIGREAQLLALALTRFTNDMSYRAALSDTSELGK